MSGFDGMFRTQQFTEGMRNEAADFSNRAHMGAAQTALDTARDIRDYRQRAVESAAKLQLWETENQINQRKLMQLQALDMTEMARLDVLGKQQSVLQNQLALEAGKFQLDQQKKQASMLSDDQKKEMMISEWENSTMGRDPLERAINGWVNTNGRWGRAQNKEERDQAIRQAREDMRLAKGGINNRDYTRDAALREMDQIKSFLSSSSADSDPKLRDEMAARWRQLQQEYDKEYRGGVGPMQTQRQPAAKSSEAKPIGRVNAQTKAMMMPAIEEGIHWEDQRFAPMKSQPSVVRAISDVVEHLVATKGYEPRMAAMIVGNEMAKNQAMVADILMRAGYSDDIIKNYMEIVWGYKDKEGTDRFVRELRSKWETEGR